MGSRMPFLIITVLFDIILLDFWSKSYKSKQCWPHRIFFWNFFLEFFFIYKNLHIELFNYSIKRVCFESTFLPVLITELPTLVERQIKTNAIYPNRWHTLDLPHYICATERNQLAINYCLDHFSFFRSTGISIYEEISIIYAFNISFNQSQGLS